ncbi:UNVERIFIED_CONTAM: NADH-ubiquinone oxidoreductase chain 6 [Sesamum calycinum]|uniref:NADH-ubiquinone oxidoreductase chain 6 n=1 Tax=Sesamum calycinum TaxID=2727403 RepID=A0AAW2JHT4_9LAMI
MCEAIFNCLSSLLKSVQKDLECFLISVGVKVQPGRPHREREWDPDPRKENAISSGTSRSSSFYFFYSRRGEIINSIRCQLFPEKLAARLDRACEGFDFPSSGSGSASASSVSTPEDQTIGGDPPVVEDTIRIWWKFNLNGYTYLVCNHFFKNFLTRVQRLSTPLLEEELPITTSFPTRTFLEEPLPLKQPNHLTVSLSSLDQSVISSGPGSGIFVPSQIARIVPCLDFFAMIFPVVHIGAIAVSFLFVVMMFNIQIAEIHEEVLRYLPDGFIPEYATRGQRKARRALARRFVILGGVPYKRSFKRHDCCDQELLNIIEKRLDVIEVEDKVKSEPTLGSDHSRSEVLGCKGDGF